MRLVAISVGCAPRPRMDSRGVGEDELRWLAEMATWGSVATLLLQPMARRLRYSRRRGTAEDEVDYYLAQRAWPKHQKYHTTHPFYLKLELVAARAKGALAWDPRTGNFPDPSAAKRVVHFGGQTWASERVRAREHRQTWSTTRILDRGLYLG